MTQLELRLLSLSKEAYSVAKKTGKEIPVFNGLPEWPSESVSPIWIVSPDQILSILKEIFETSPFLRAVTMRQKYDPDEKSLWVFCPACDGSDEVWLVRTRTVEHDRN